MADREAGPPGNRSHAPALAWRRGTMQDAPAIRALTRAAYAKWVSVIGREPRPMQADYAVALQKHRFDLLLCDEMLVALIETVAESLHLLIVNVAVEPGSQGRGFGHLLMANAESIARSSGFHEIRLYTNKLFIENLRLYAKLGYVLDREELFAGGVIVHMIKVLGP